MASPSAEIPKPGGPKGAAPAEPALVAYTGSHQPVLGAETSTDHNARQGASVLRAGALLLDAPVVGPATTVLEAQQRHPPLLGRPLKQKVPMPA